MSNLSGWELKATHLQVGILICQTQDQRGDTISEENHNLQAMLMSYFHPVEPSVSLSHVELEAGGPLVPPPCLQLLCTRPSAVYTSQTRLSGVPDSPGDRSDSGEGIHFRGSRTPWLRDNIQ